MSLIFSISRLGDPDEIYDHVNTWEQEYIQLKKGQFAWQVDAINIGEFQFSKEIVNISTLIRGQIPTGCVVLALPINFEGDDSFLGHAITHQTVLKAVHADSFDLKIGKKLENLIMVAPVNQVLMFAERAQCPISEEDLLSPGIIICDAVAQHNLSRYLDELFFY